MVASFASYLVDIFTHLKLCLTRAIYNFKWVENIYILKIGNQ